MEKHSGLVTQRIHATAKCFRMTALLVMLRCGGLILSILIFLFSKKIANADVAWTVVAHESYEDLIKYLAGLKLFK